MSFDEVTKQIELELHNTCRGETHFSFGARYDSLRRFDLFKPARMSVLCLQLQ